MPSNINIVNNINDVSLTMDMAGGLSTSAYVWNGGTVSANTRKRCLSFNRNEDVKNGKTYTFSIYFMLGSLTFKGYISLTGTATSSNYWFQMNASDPYGQAVGPTQLSDEGTRYFATHVGAVGGQTLSYGCTVRRYLYGSYDDIDITLNPAGQSTNQNIIMPDYRKRTEIPLLDVWGESRLTCQEGVVTGFTQAYNVNMRETPMNCANEVPFIPNLIKVDDYERPIFNLKDGCVRFMTHMGSPLTRGTASEMYRVLNKKYGTVIFFAPDAKVVAAFEAEMKQLVYKPSAVLGSPFNQIMVGDGTHRVYGFPDANIPIGL